jgi:hypothetical protein
MCYVVPKGDFGNEGVGRDILKFVLNLVMIFMQHCIQS